MGIFRTDEQANSLWSSGDSIYFRINPDFMNLFILVLMWVLNQVNKLYRDKKMKEKSIENLKKESISWVLTVFNFITALIDSLMWLICIILIGVCSTKNDITFISWVYFTLYVVVIAVIMRQDTKNVTVNLGIGLFRAMKYFAVVFFICELIFEVNYGNSSGS